MTSVVLQLDPASLGLWFGVPSSGDQAADGVYADASNAVLLGDQEGVRAAVDAAADEQTARRTAALASTVWHEMRHFADLVLTNFGCFKTRRYLSVYVNLSQVVAALRDDAGRVHCPVTDYLDDVTRLLHGLKPPPDDVVPLLRDMQTRTEMAQDDLTFVPTAMGQISVGGKAQFEAIAYLCQSEAVTWLLGNIGESVAALWDVPDAQVMRANYAWVAALEALGLVQSIDLGRGVVSVIGEPLLPLLYGCLATRHWGQKQVRNDEGGSGYPAERLYGLARRLGPKWKEDWPSWAESWDQVNEAASDLWGRTVLEESSEDLRRFGEMAEQVRDRLGPEAPVSRWVTDLYGLRKRMFALLEVAPELLLNISSLPTLASLLSVPVITAAPGGQDYPVDPDRGVLSAYQEPGSDAQSGWWWATAYRFREESDRLGFHDYEAWAAIASHLAPATKLLTQGRRHRVMLGPELITEEQILRSRGIDLSFAPAVEFPDDDTRTDVFWHFRATDTAHCDLCHAIIHRSGGALVSPWAFRADRTLAAIAIKALGGGDDGYKRFVRDWSAWLVCNFCQRQLADLCLPRYRHLVLGAAS